MKSQSVTIKMKAIEQCFPMVLFIILLTGQGLPSKAYIYLARI